jgi:hypothetical protein
MRILMLQRVGWFVSNRLHEEPPVEMQQAWPRVINQLFYQREPATLTGLLQNQTA